ncbi:MAG: helix-turn-helix transcriptional regulator [Synergistaceae bacterium]|nr:helix-turn-helix transcriptional regulator [Synergistaceae bacterium]
MKGLRIIRKQRKLTLREVEDITGIDANTISRYERGVLSPNSKTADKIAAKLGVTVDELLNEPQGDEIKLTLSWHWEEIKECEVNMDSNKFQIVLGDSGQIGITGAALFPSSSAIEDFIARVREQVEVAYDAQVRRGVIKEAATEI